MASRIATDISQFLTWFHSFTVLFCDVSRATFLCVLSPLKLTAVCKCLNDVYWLSSRDMTQYPVSQAVYPL